MTALRREDLVRALPYARRYARALSGSQPGGDAVVAGCLQELLESSAPEADARLALYGRITQRLTPAKCRGDEPKMGTLTLRQRQLLLLTSLEELPIDAAATVVLMPPQIAAEQLTLARDSLRDAAATDVLIIEDEPIIAMDIEELVLGCGHRVVGIAGTEAEAVDLAKKHQPGLILADINLGAGGDGAAAVQRIMRHHYAPVIFVTAYPERLLTGEAVEPTFVITKPFEPLTLAIATFQAVTGGVQLD